jgi:hypothetical protein
VAQATVQVLARLQFAHDVLVKHRPEWQDRGNGEVRISHAAVTEADFDRLASVERLTAWNVHFPDRFLAELSHLSWLDIRGGSGRDLARIAGCTGLRGLVVNQVRGLEDASEISALINLEVLSLYGLARLSGLPRLASLLRLRRIELGQLRVLHDWAALAEAPGLEELVFQNKLYPDDEIVEKLARHPTLRAFSWFAPDEPISKVESVTQRLGKPPASIARPEEWLRGHS